MPSILIMDDHIRYPEVIQNTLTPWNVAFTMGIDERYVVLHLGVSPKDSSQMGGSLESSHRWFLFQQHDTTGEEYFCERLVEDIQNTKSLTFFGWIRK